MAHQHVLSNSSCRQHEVYVLLDAIIEGCLGETSKQSGGGIWVGGGDKQGVWKGSEVERAWKYVG